MIFQNLHMYVQCCVQRVLQYCIVLLCFALTPKGPTSRHTARHRGEPTIGIPTPHDKIRIWNLSQMLNLLVTMRHLVLGAQSYDHRARQSFTNSSVRKDSYHFLLSRAIKDTPTTHWPVSPLSLASPMIGRDRTVWILCDNDKNRTYEGLEWAENTLSFRHLPEPFEKKYSDIDSMADTPLRTV